MQAVTSRDSRSKTRPSKRGAREMAANDSESEDDFEDMDVDKRDEGIEGGDNGMDDDDRETPQPLEEEDGTTTDDEDLPPPRTVENAGSKTADRPSAKKPDSPPPRRELPFTRKNQPQPQPQLTAEGAEDTAGETDDDEL